MDSEIAKFKEQPKGFATRALHDGQDPDKWKSRAVIPPIVMSTTFKQESPGKHSVRSCIQVVVKENVRTFVLPQLWALQSSTDVSSSKNPPTTRRGALLESKNILR